jgi:hypothetical protein
MILISKVYLSHAGYLVAKKIFPTRFVDDYIHNHIHIPNFIFLLTVTIKQILRLHVFILRNYVSRKLHEKDGQILSSTVDQYRLFSINVSDYSRPHS